jgi:hypothetical protein
MHLAVCPREGYAFSQARCGEHCICDNDVVGVPASAERQVAFEYRESGTGDKIPNAASSDQK